MHARTLSTDCIDLSTTNKANELGSKSHLHAVPSNDQNVWGRLTLAWARELRSFPNQLVVAIVLTAHANQSTGDCFPSVQTISDESGVPINRTYTALRALEKRGFFTRRVESRLGQPGSVRTYYDLQMMRSSQRRGAVIAPSLVRSSHQCIKVREQPIELPIEQNERGPGMTTKIIPNTLKRHATPTPTDAAPPSPARQQSARQKTIYDLESWFVQTCFSRPDRSQRQSNAWGWLLDYFDGNVAMVQQVCKEAYERKDKLCTDEWPVWRLQTVLFYVQYKRKETETVDHERTIDFFVVGDKVNNVEYIREYIKLYAVPEQIVRRVLHGRLYEQVYPKAAS